jgi:hypothetical protein
MKLPIQAQPVVRAVSTTKGLSGKITASIFYNWETGANCKNACDTHGNLGIPHESCIHECYWETDLWKSWCHGRRYC